MTSTRSTEVDNWNNTVDSREVIDRIAELEERLAPYEGKDVLAEVQQRLFDELEVLSELAAQGESSPDWAYGEVLIRDTYFVEYAQGLAEGIGAVDHDASWPYNCIDWERAARELQMDYTALDWDGVTFWIRA